MDLQPIVETAQQVIPHAAEMGNALLAAAGQLDWKSLGLEAARWVAPVVPAALLAKKAHFYTLCSNFALPLHRRHEKISPLGVAIGTFLATYLAGAGITNVDRIA